MPFTVDEDKLKTGPGQTPVASLDLAHPPVKEIPHMDFPKILYKHPKEPFTTIEHRNTRHEIVEVETVPTEHITLVVNNDQELRDAMKKGWIKEPYIPKAPPPPPSLYD